MQIAKLRGMQNKPWALSKEAKEKIVSRYRCGLAIQSILERSGITYQTLYRVLRMYKVPLRNRHKWRK